MNKSNQGLSEVESQNPDKDGLVWSFGSVAGVFVPPAALLDRIVEKTVVRGSGRGPN
jgi:hypothetical protein